MLRRRRGQVFDYPSLVCTGVQGRSKCLDSGQGLKWRPSQIWRDAFCRWISILYEGRLSLELNHFLTYCDILESFEQVFKSYTRNIGFEPMLCFYSSKVQLLLSSQREIGGFRPRLTVMFTVIVTAHQNNSIRHADTSV